MTEHADLRDASRRTFSIVVPVFQNEESLEETFSRLLALRSQLSDYDLELVMVDDGSRGRSFEILTEYAQRYPETIKLVKLTRNFGQTAATQAGLKHATGACVGIISADLQEPCELFVDMIHEWEKGAKFVIGERRSRAEGWWHRQTSGIYWRLAGRAFPDFPPMGYDFCLLDRQVVEGVNRINEKNSSIFLLIYWLGFEPVRLPVDRGLRGAGRSQWSLWKKVAFTVDTLLGFTYLPARLITILGFATAALCMLHLLVMIVMYFHFGTAPAGWMTLVGLVALFGSVILFALGIISEYLLRILDETRKRPPYVVEQVVNLVLDQKDEGPSSASQRDSVVESS